MRKLSASLLALALFCIHFSASAQNTFPVNDVATPNERCYAFLNATIVKDGLTVLTNATLLIKKGKIENIGNNVSVPKEAIVIDCKGKYIYPSFIDIHSDYGISRCRTGKGQ